MKAWIQEVKQNNKGLSLVELIVAISVGVIISGAVASIIVISTRMYSRETTNIAEQYEIQTTLNRTVDSAENAQWFALGSTVDGVATEYVAFGKLTGSSSDNTVAFEGEIFASDYDSSHPGKFNVYMNQYTSAGPLSIGKEVQAGDVVRNAAASIRTEQYLLGEGAVSYVVGFADGDNSFTDSAVAKMSDGTVCKGFYRNSLMVTVSMDFEKKSMTGDIKKHVEDTVTFRNRLKRPVYYLGSYYMPELK